MGLGRQGERERARGRERAWAGRSTSSFTCAGHHHGARGKDPHLHPPICTHKSSHTHSLALAHLPIAIAVSVAPDRGFPTVGVIVAVVATICKMESNKSYWEGGHQTLPVDDDGTQLDDDGKPLRIGNQHNSLPPVSLLLSWRISCW